MVEAVCPRCSTVVALHVGRPRVTSGSIEVWHPECWELRDVPLLPPVAEVIAIAAPEPPTPRRRGWKLPGDAVSRAIGGSIAASTVGAAVLAAITLYPTTPDASSVRNEAAAEAAIVTPGMRSASVAFEPKPVLKPVEYRKLEQRYEIPMENGVALDETFPTLGSWIHPISAAHELFPTAQPARWFGAERTGITPRPECGMGHCGVDLDGPRGRPIVAVAAGKLVVVEHHEMGSDGLSGRYVRILHDDGTLTAYMHMDEIADGLMVGDRVQAGQFVGTLGATAVGSTPPHLHFHLEVPNDKKGGDYSNTHFVDPAPFLVRSSVIPLFDHRRPLKPAF